MDTKPIIHNARALCLQPRGISVLTVKAPMELSTQHIYKLNASNNLPLGIISLAGDYYKINHKYPKSL